MKEDVEFLNEESDEDDFQDDVDSLNLDD